MSHKDHHSLCSDIQHNFCGPPLFFVEGLLSTGPTPFSLYLFVEIGLPLHHKDFKCIKLCLSQIQTCLEAFLGFLGKTKIVVMCCQIVSGSLQRHLAAIIGSYTPVDKIRKFLLVKSGVFLLAGLGMGGPIFKLSKYLF